MRDILIVSDSHGKVDRLEKLISYRQRLLKKGEVLEVIFLGDGLCDVFSCKQYDSVIFHAVRGNCDIGERFSPYGEEIPLYRLINIGDLKIFLCHGHTLSVKGGYDELCREASRQGADIALFGHTHFPTLEYIKKGSVRDLDKDIAIFNPGSLGDGFGSFGNLSLSNGEFLLSHGQYHNISQK